MKKALSLALALFMVVLLVTFAFAQEKKATKKAAEKPGAVMVDVLTVTASVDAVDAANRMVTLKMSDGTMRTIKAGPEVRNFDQIKVGDKVKAKYYQSVAIFVAKTGETPSASDTNTVQVAPKGAKPGAVAVNTMEITAKVEGIDYKKRTVSLKGPKGNLRTFTVDNSVKNFKNIKKGDDVILRVTEAMAIMVEASAN